MQTNEVKNGRSGMFPIDDTPKAAYEEGRYADARRMLLEEYSRKPVRRLMQIDCFADMWGDTAQGHDDDGHSLMSGYTHELKNLDDVRILIPEGSDKEQTLAILAKASIWLSEDWERLMAADDSPRFAGSRVEEAPSDW
jgi:hypothetical protein